FLPTTSPTAVWHDRTASPLTCTVQAPHRPAPQPNLVPVICNCSLMAQSSGESFAASTDFFCPLIMRSGIVSSPAGVGCRLRRQLTKVGWLDAHRVSASCVQHLRVRVARQFNLEIFAENKFSKCVCALRHEAV